MTNSHTTRGVAASLLAAARSEQLTFLAAAIAYYGFVSTVPLVVIGLAAATFVGGDALATAVLAGVEGLVTPAASAVVRDALTSGAGRGGATALGLVVLAWSGLRLFRGLDVAFSWLYGAAEPETLADQLRDGLVALGSMVVAVLLLAGLVAALPALDVPLPVLVRPVVAAVALTAVFYPLYYTLPDRPLGVREALPGAALAGVGWTLLASALSLYATYAASFRLYGVVGGVLLASTWFYAGAVVVLLGALLNAVLAGRPVDRQLQHEPRRGPAHPGPMTERDDTDEVDTVEPREVDPEDLAGLRRDLDALAADLESKTKAREDLEADLRRYVRWRLRRGHARGWGPYLVLLYGTVMTLGAFYYLSGGWAVLAMVVVWLSTLGLYVLMVIVGAAVGAVGLPGRIAERLRNLR